MKRHSIFSVLFPLIGICSCDLAGDSSNEIIKQISNGNGKRAVLFMKYGGATVDNSLQVSIISEGDKIKDVDVGNVFISNKEKGTIDNNDVIISWNAPDTLIISYDPNLKIFIEEKIKAGVVILYKKLNSD